jgi:hypothetical protein
MHVQSSINNVKTKIIAVGATESGKIAHVLAIKRDGSHAGMDTRIKQLPIAPRKRSLFHASDAMRRQIVIEFFSSFNIMLYYVVLRSMGGSLYDDL